MAIIDRPVMIDWQLSSYFGWGVYGINLMLNWNQQQRHALLTNIQVSEPLIHLNPLEWAMLAPALKPSLDWHAEMKSHEGHRVTLQIPILHPMGNNFELLAARPMGAAIAGTPSLGVIFFESTEFTAAGLERAQAMPLIVAGSTWNQTVMKHHGLDNSALVLQGVDPTRFHPAPRAGWFSDRFTIFTGGKLEYRKGQDLALRAFRIFAERHSEALLVAAWECPWPKAAESLSADATLPPVPYLPDGRVDCLSWAAANGIRGDQFANLSSLPNGAMAPIYREMDIALFPNRAEGGTNLVAMECMASGVPVILSANTGHLDLIASGRCYALSQQASIPGAGTIGWGESSIDEIVAILEAAYSDKAGREARAGEAAAFMSGMTWSRTAARVAEAIAPCI